jgi:acetyl-CoA acetyltransferase family protein
MRFPRARTRAPPPRGEAADSTRRSFPVFTTFKDPKTGEVRDIVVKEDDGIRTDVDVNALAKLPAVFKKGGSTTPGNASQISDGAGCVVLAKRSYAEKEGLPIIAKFVSFAAVGVDPKVMGIGPAVAIPEAVKKANMAVSEIDLFELNEAFASQATYCAEKLGLDHERVNVNGGAIALGHPLGATGARCVATLLHEMRTEWEENGGGVDVHRERDGRGGRVRRRVTS